MESKLPYHFDNDISLSITSNTSTKTQGTKGTVLFS